MYIYIWCQVSVPVTLGQSTRKTAGQHISGSTSARPRYSQNDIEDTHGNQHIAWEAVVSTGVGFYVLIEHHPTIIGDINSKKCPGK